MHLPVAPSCLVSPALKAQAAMVVMMELMLVTKY